MCFVLSLVCVSVRVSRSLSARFSTNSRVMPAAARLWCEARNRTDRSTGGRQSGAEETREERENGSRERETEG